MTKFYVFVRWWPYFTSSFPFERFNELSEEDIEDQLRAVADQCGPPDDTIREQKAAAALLGRRQSASPDPQYPPVPRVKPTVKMQEWSGKQAAGKAIAAGSEPTITQRQYPFLVEKMQYLGWLRGPVLWAWQFRRRYVVLSTPSKQKAKDIASALTRRFAHHVDNPHFGIVSARKLKRAELALFDLEENQHRIDAMNPTNSTELSKVVRVADELQHSLTSLVLHGDTGPGGQETFYVFRYLRNLAIDFGKDAAAAAKFTQVAFTYRQIVGRNPAPTETSDRLIQYCNVAAKLGGPAAEKIFYIVRCLYSVEIASDFLSKSLKLSKLSPLAEVIVAQASRSSIREGTYMYLLLLLDDIASSWHSLESDYRNLASVVRTFGVDQMPFLSASQFSAAQKDLAIAAGNTHEASKTVAFQVGAEAIYAETAVGRAFLDGKIQELIAAQIALDKQSQDGKEVIKILADRVCVEPRLLRLKSYLDMNPDATLREIERDAAKMGHVLPRSSINALLRREVWIAHPPRGRRRKTTTTSPDVIAQSIPDRNTRPSS